MKKATLLISLTDDQIAKVTEFWDAHGEHGGVMLAQPRIGSLTTDYSRISIAIFDVRGAELIFDAVSSASLDAS